MSTAVLPELSATRTGAGVVRESSALEVWLNAAATLQAVWFYLAYVHCYVDLTKFEHGMAHAPYQYRLLLMLPLRWAHESALCARIAAGLTHLHSWFPTGVHPESLLEFPVDLAGVAVAGLVARRIYLAASRTGLLAAAVYPLTLLMVVGTYCLGTMYRLRFVYDLPSLGFFAAGMFLLYFERPRWQFALLFAVATINRETTLFLLAMFALVRWQAMRRNRWTWKETAVLRDATFAAGLLLAWCAWHVWVAHRFAANGTESWSRLLLNVKAMLLPMSWLQLMSSFAFCGPLALVWHRRLRDEVLRAWLLVVPLWFAFMLHYGLLLESRVFGELIPLLACCVALGAEETLLRRLRWTRMPGADQDESCLVPVDAVWLP